MRWESDQGRWNILVDWILYEAWYHHNQGKYAHFGFEWHGLHTPQKKLSPEAPVIFINVKSQVSPWRILYAQWHSKIWNVITKIRYPNYIVSMDDQRHLYWFKYPVRNEPYGMIGSLCSHRSVATWASSYTEVGKMEKRQSTKYFRNGLSPSECREK